MVTEETVRKIMVRLPEDEAEILEAEARQKGTTLSAYCRQLLSRYVNSKTMDQELNRRVLEILQSETADEILLKKVKESLKRLSENP